MFRKVFSSPSRDLPLNDVLELANEQIENARNANTPAKALRICNDAKTTIKDAGIIFSNNRVGGQTSNEDIANAYHKLGKVQEELGQHSDAQKSFKKATKWGYIEKVTQQTSASQLANSRSSIGQSLLPRVALVATPSITTAMAMLDLNDASSSHQGTPSVINGQMFEARSTHGSAELGTHMIFDHDVSPPAVKLTLPEPGSRISSTSQLAYCLSLMNHSLISREGLEISECESPHVKIDDPNEQTRLRGMATDLVRAFIRDELKKPDVVAEIVCLAAVLEQDDFRKLLQAFVDGINNSLLLEIHLLEGLSNLIRNSPQGTMDADDLVRILELIGMRLRSTHQQSIQHIYRLALTVSSVLDSMVDSQVEGIARELLHEPLSEYLKELQKSSDPCLIYQAAYAYQALRHIPDDETFLRAMFRRTGKVVQGIFGVVSAVKTLDLDKFIERLDDIQKGLPDAIETIGLISDAYENVKTLAESGQGFYESLKEGLSFTRKSAWYPALRGLDALVQEGRFTEFERLIREAPCRRDAGFQWGVCQRLGDLASNIIWDTDIRKHAVSLLTDIYRDDSRWGDQASVKQWILHILGKLAESSESTVADHAQRLLQDLEAEGDSKKRALYQSCMKEDHSPFLMMVTLPPPQGSRLLDFVQNKTNVKTPLRQLKQERLRDRGGDIYISPRAKIHSSATDDFDLTLHVEKFLASDKKVFLLLGDSGAGKSTFNRALELSLWDKYDRINGRIPLLVHLPTIGHPEEDLIDKQFRRLNFTHSQIRELKLHHQLILICDGYDESQQTQNLYMSNQFNQPGQWQVQMVISCRTEYTGVDYKDCFRPTDRNGGGALNLFQEAVITPFNKDQIQDYVDQYVRLRSPSWESKDYLQALKQIPNLQDLVTNPFLLKLSLEVLPNLVDTKGDYSQTRVTRVELYDRFVQQWIERGKIRLGEMKLNPRDKETFKILLASGFGKQGITYLKKLATAIYDNQPGNPVVSYSELGDQGTWKRAFFDNSNGNNLLREAIPLTRNNDQYRFIHKSVLEYGLAIAVFDPSQCNENTESPSTLIRRRSAGSIESFEYSSPIEDQTVAIEQSLIDSPFGRRSFVDQESILQFLVERVQQNEVFKQQLLAVIDRSKTEKDARIAAANAITVLVRAGVQFIGSDLRGIQIPGADLSYGMFDSAQLDGADLRKVNLCNIWLRNASLCGSRMKGAQFGELPLLQQRDIVWSCTYSHDGKLLAVGLVSGYINLYDTSDWEKIQTLVGHSDTVWYLAFSKAGGHIASCSKDKTVRLWDVEVGNCVGTLLGHSRDVRSVAFSPNGDCLVSGSCDKTVRLWDVESSSCILTLTGHDDSVNSVTYSPNEDQIASGSGDKTVRLWGAETGSCVQVLSGHGDAVFSVAYSPNGDRIVSGSADMTVRLWDIGTATCIHILQGHGHLVTSAAYSPNGDQIASGNTDSTVRLWNVETGNCTQILQGHSRPIRSIAYSPSGGQIASGSRDCTVRLWNLESRNLVHAGQNNNSYISSLAFSPKGDRIVSGGFDNTVQLWDVETGIRTRTLQGHSNFVYSVTHSSDGNLIASGGRDKTLRIWNVETGNCINTLHGHGGIVWSVAFSPDGHWVASGGSDKIVRLWNVETGNCVNSFEGHRGEVNSVAYSPNGKQIVSGSDDMTVRLWDIETNDCGRTLEGHNGSVSCITYSPNGSRIASGSNDGTIRLWDVGKGDSVHILSGRSNEIWSVAYSPNGDMIASGSWDNTVRLWDSESGQFLTAISSFSGPVTSVAWKDTLKGRYLATGSMDRSVRCWQIIKEQDEYEVYLHWTSSRGALTLDDASFIDVQGLSQIDLKLLNQRKALTSSSSSIA